MENYIDIFYKLWEHAENEVVEFKRALTNYDVDELGKYFSALSNEANLRQREFAWLIMGVWDKKHIIEGTSWKDGEMALNKLKQDMSQHTTDSLIFREIVPIYIEGKRVLMFKIPASPRNIVMHWKGIAYARDGESLKPLNQTKRDEIRFQDPTPDWSAELVESATIDDLYDLALAKARVMFKRVHASNIPAEEVDGWTVEEFLTHSNVMRDGKLTRAALILLGKPTSLSLLHPAIVRITWTREDKDTIVEDYEHFSIPLILTVDNVLAKINNTTMRELPGGTLFPDTMKQYDDYTIRETLHNAIAHQDYRMQERITFVERPDSIYCSNGGSFIPGTVEDAIEHAGPQRHYRNDCLCQGMVNFNMIDTVGRGIKKMFTEQRKRFFPMPDYDIDPEKQMVGVTIYGKMLNENYTALLKSSTELSLRDCILLDAVQKHRPLTNEAKNYLKAHKLIEGRNPNYTISLAIAKLTKQVPEYTKNKGLHKSKLMNMIVQYVQNSETEGAKLSGIQAYVKEAMSRTLSDSKQKRSLAHILEELKNADIIYPMGKRWHINNLTAEDIQLKITKITK